MKVKVLFLLQIIFSYLSVVSLFSDDTPDYYKVLGIRQFSSVDQARRAYKKLAKQWHPDKNRSPEASKKFVDINLAHEVLGDPKKKEQYDQRLQGIKSQFVFDFDDIRKQGGFPFGDWFDFNENGQRKSKMEIFTKHRMGMRTYKNTVYEKSFSVPYLIFIYSDFCIPCLQLADIWEKTVNDLEPLGFGIATVNAYRDGNLVNELDPRHVPMLLVLANGKTIQYPDTAMNSVRQLVDFVRTAVPDYVAVLTDSNFRTWMDDNWRRDNKVSVIMCGPKDKPRLRFLLAAMRYRSYASFGYLAMKSKATEEFREIYRVSTSTKSFGGLETLLIFNERVDAPVFNVQAKEIPTDTLISSLEANKFLMVPRLASQTHFDDLCPPSSTIKRLCIILLIRAKTDPSDDVHLNAFRDFVEKSLSSQQQKSDDVKYAYLYEDRQSNFVYPLISTSANQDDDEDVKHDADKRRPVVIVWRTAKHQAKLKLLRSIWSGHPDLINQSSESLSAKLEPILNRDDDGHWRRHVDLNELVDENALTGYKRLLVEFWKYYDEFWRLIQKEELKPLISVLGTLLALFFFGWLVNLFTNEVAEDEALKKTTSSKLGNVSPKEIKELTARTYVELVRGTVAGVRTIVLIVDEQSKDSLLKEFEEQISFRNGDNFLFGYVVFDRNYSWFQSLLACTTVVDFHFPACNDNNWKDFIGTVLSLNGHRRYFNIYYPKKEKLYSKQYLTNSQFLGFDSAESSDDDGATKSKLLDGFSNWMDRLIEGSSKKYSLTEWPTVKLLK